MAKIKEIIARVDAIKFNDYSDEIKLRMVAVLDGKIAVDVLLMHPSETGQFNYTYPEGLEMEPLVHFPHDDLYEKWIEAQIDFKNGEYEKYQNSMEQFNAAYENFVNWLLSYHTPEAYLGKDPGGTGGSPLYYITAYGLAVKQGYEGTLAEWLASLKGEKGDTGAVEDLSEEQIGMVAARALENLVVDPTLSKPGSAADAAVVGKAVEKLSKVVSISGGEDLDRLVTPGRYACETDDIAKTLQGCDQDKAFTLDVRYANGVGPYVGQELRPRDGGARLYRQFVKYHEILNADAKDLYERVQRGLSDANAYDGYGASEEWYYNGPAEDGFYHIQSMNDLYGLASLVNSDEEGFEGKTIALDNDIILNTGNAFDWRNSSPGWTWTPIGSNTSMYFAGTFDGCGHIISGLYSDARNNNGLFGFTYGATIKNLAVVNSYFSTDAFTGQFLGSVAARVLSGGTLKNVYSDAILESRQGDWFTGGIAGCIKDSKADSCVFAGTIFSNQGTGKSNKYIGGITGGPDSGGNSAELTNCLFIGAIESNDSGVGGIAGILGPGSLIDGCVSAGTIEGNAKQVGAVLGWVSGTGNHAITNCYYSAELGRNLYAGGDAGSVAETTGSKVLPAECVAHSMIPTKWAKVLDSANNDYIVAQGTSGDWTYRKWASGLAEMWGSYHNVTNFTGAVTMPLPFEVVPWSLSAWAGGYHHNDETASNLYTVMYATTTTVNITAWKHNSDAKSTKASCRIYARAMWK